MKYTFFALLIIAFTNVVYAQNAAVPAGVKKGPGRVTGKIIDSLSRAALEYATIAITEAAEGGATTSVITDASGNFRLDNLALGNYHIAISYIGYPVKKLSAILLSANKPAAELGVITLAGGSKSLQEVQVVGETPLIENKIDKIVYNVEKDITASGGTATDVLGKVPLVSVDMNGNVSVRGNQNVRIMINGKSTGSAAASISDVLRSIPADQIKNIEVITAPSAKYDAEGSAGIINIITRQKNVSGISGSLNGGVGTRQNNGNFNLNYNNSGFHATVNLGGFLSWKQTAINDFEQYINNGTVNTYTSTKGTSRTGRHGLNNGLNMGYDFDTLNSVNMNFRISDFRFDNDGASNTISATPYSFTSEGLNSFSNFDWSADFTHKFKKPGAELSFSTQWSRGSGVTNYTNKYTAVFSNLKNDINGKNNEYTFQLDYTLPINKAFKLEAGGKTILRRINSITDFFDMDQDAQFIFDPARSNAYGYDQNVFAGYGVLTVNLAEKWSVLAGLRNEHTGIKGTPSNQLQALEPFEQNYNTFVPSLTLQRKLGKMNTLKAIYSKRITRPSLQYLNPFVNSSNPQSQTAGNPALSPEVTHSIELGYNMFLGKSVLNTSVYYRRTTGLIEGIATPISVIVDGVSQGGTFTQYQNVGVNNSIGGSLFGNLTPFKNFTITGNINGFTYKPNASSINSTDVSKTSTYVLYNGFLRGSLTLPKDLIAEMFGFGSSPRRTVQGVNPAFRMYGFGVKKQFLQKKLSLGLNVTQPFSDRMNFKSSVQSATLSQTNNFSVPFRSFGLTFGYNFGKMSFSGPQKRKGVNNDDLKQGDQGGGMGTGGTN
ncbi:MAG TPA: TonB-dependent receptor [Pedobacter sp.]|nr:TonB-dependent receptor [Pedobacter sp.]